MSWSFFICHLTYFLICSSSRPTVLTHYPRAQKCLPQYRFFSSVCRSNIFMALFPFRNPTTSDTECFGGIETTKWMWSTCTFPSRILILFHSHNCRIISRTDFPTSPRKIRNRYFGHQTTWYLHSHTAWANLLNSCIKYLLSMSRVTHPHLKEVFSIEEISITHLPAKLLLDPRHSRGFKWF